MSDPSPTDASPAAERMEALGRLAGGVAHDFNNVLMVISGYAEMLAQSVDDPDSQDAVQTILDAAERAGTLTRQLLLFSRRQSIDPADVAVVPALLELEAPLRRLLHDSVSLVIDAADDTLVARVDPAQLELMVRNLVIHARDAMPAGGRVTIHVSAVHRAPFVDAWGDTAAAGPYIRLAVSDTGGGVTDGGRDRLFEPFFTTKIAGKGAGLGLATVYGIARSCGGFVDVAATPGLGTTFEVLLPVAAEAGAQPERGA